MSTRFFTLMVTTLVLLTLPLAAQGKSNQTGQDEPEPRQVVIDMATCGENETQSVDPRTKFIELKILNRMPNSRYEIEVIKSEIEEEPLSTANFSFGGEGLVSAPRGGPESAGDENCANIKDQLAKAADEVAVAVIGASTAGKVKDCFDALTKTTEKLNIEVFPGQKIDFTVTRDGKKCSSVWTTGLPGKWYTTYGFTFLPNRDRNYFAKQTTIPAVPATSTSPAKPESTVFKITEEEDREDLDFVPSILFHYKRPKTNWTWVAGLGYDLENIAAFFGRGYIIHQNVLVTAGLAIHEQGDLAGRYNVGEDLKEAIDSAQLSSKSYGANLYVGVSFRFGSNIFSERDTAAKKVADERAKKAETAQKAAEAKLLASQKLDACSKRVEAKRIVARQGCENADSDSCADLEGDEEKACQERKAATEKACIELAEANAKAGEAECKVNPDYGKDAAGGAGQGAPDSGKTETEESGDAQSAGGKSNEPAQKPTRPTPAQVLCTKEAAFKRAQEEAKCLKDNKDYLLTKGCLTIAQKQEAFEKAKCFTAVEKPAAPAKQ